MLKAAKSTFTEPMVEEQPVPKARKSKDPKAKKPTSSRKPQKPFDSAKATVMNDDGGERGERQSVFHGGEAPYLANLFLGLLFHIGLRKGWK
ncbi:hypothetical protein U1Q18_017072 [Sarracenia purpurea var. burkii]